MKDEQVTRASTGFFARLADYLLVKSEKDSMEQTFLEVTKEALFDRNPEIQQEAVEKLNNHSKRKKK